MREKERDEKRIDCLNIFNRIIVFLRKSVHVFVSENYSLVDSMVTYKIDYVLLN